MNQIVQKLCSGTWSRAYRQMGAHPGRSGGRDGWRFRVWAPNASDVSLAGDFSGWQPLPMVRKDGLWECFVPGAKEFDSYKYVVTGADGHTRWKADPYAVHSQTRPETASKLFDMIQSLLYPEFALVLSYHKGGGTVNRFPSFSAQIPFHYSPGSATFPPVATGSCP